MYPDHQVLQALLIAQDAVDRVVGRRHLRSVGAEELPVRVKGYQTTHLFDAQPQQFTGTDIGMENL